MSFALSTIQLRYQQLTGQPTGTIDAFGTSNINAAIRDILNKYNFTWNRTTANITLTSGVATLPADYNPQWHLEDARVVVSGTDDYVFTEIQASEKSNYADDSYVYWITYDTTTDRYIFNSLAADATVNVTYNFTPTDLSLAADKCFIPDLEAVSYLSASKKWVGAERDTELKAIYEQNADKLILAMYVHDMVSQDSPSVYSITSVQSW
jgi:hypothetical protein